MSNTILEANNLTKRYGKLIAVNKLSFKFKSGEVYGILGPNGSGKTTTLAMISDVIRSTSGTYSWFGTKSGSNQRRRLGIMLEKPNFYEYLSGLDNMKIVADIRNVAHADIATVMKQIGLYERQNSKFKTYSLGMKQRLAIGAAILGSPDVLILDEPTNGLDPEGIAEVRNLIIKLSKENKTIILASHLLDEVQKVCTQMLILKNGNNIYQGDFSDLEYNSQIVEIKSDNMKYLEQTLKASEDYSDFVLERNTAFVSIKENTSSAELNQFLHNNSISASHISHKKESLEDKVFKLLSSAK